MAFEMVDREIRLAKADRQSLAIDAPTMSELASPGPLVAANAATSDRSILDAFAVRLSSRGAYTRWLRDAISGTIPPYFSCSAICDATSLASNSGPE